MIYTLPGRAPRLHADSYITPSADLIGSAVIGEKASVWFGAAVRAEAGFRSERLYRLWRVVVRWIAPAAVVLILFHLLGWEIIRQMMN